ncbi:uncharacterized protein N7477_004201 [Penicillium maclennaniae]|uniref:uncharacterized protein n=1 Tax=Penicillium maclennaniae TaxID=1343394 RepID=UPI00253F65BD|nr:uncharacterized protein N7477_004201 [Penicillium maclennaniae]KAJ5678568.1 hypothetical protein N7477_004201 [Penicillium maclennaniae]
MGRLIRPNGRYAATAREYNPVAPAAPHLAWCASMVERESDQALQKALLPQELRFSSVESVHYTSFRLLVLEH